MVVQDYELLLGHCRIAQVLKEHNVDQEKGDDEETRAPILSLFEAKSVGASKCDQQPSDMNLCATKWNSEE
jgi:hypothetical protein